MHAGDRWAQSTISNFSVTVPGGPYLCKPRDRSPSTYLSRTYVQGTYPSFKHSNLTSHTTSHTLGVIHYLPMLLKGRILICYTIVVSSVVAAHNNYYGSGIDRIYPPTHKARWYRSPSFILTQPVNNYDVIYNTRGGSSAEEDDKDEDSSVTTSTDPAVEEEAAANDNDDKIVESADDTTSAQNLTFSATTSHDGSSEDPDGVPARFLLMKKDDRAEAKEAFEATLAWRKEFNVDTILSRPHSQFDVCKVLVPHYFAGEDPHGNIVFVQRPALLDFELMRKNNATIDDLLMHYIYVIEYCWNILEPGPPEGVMTNILDMRGLSFRAMKNQEYIDFGKRFVVSYVCCLSM